MRPGTSKRSPVSAGLLLFRRISGKIEVLLAHPGGPFWERRDFGAWTIPKGQALQGEDLLATAIREFCEETSHGPCGPYLPLGCVRQKAGKTVHAWAFEGDADIRTLRSNFTEIEWPPGSRRKVPCPEIDRYAWFEIPQAEQKINAAQREFLVRLQVALAEGQEMASE